MNYYQSMFKNEASMLVQTLTTGHHRWYFLSCYWVIIFNSDVYHFFNWCFKCLGCHTWIDFASLVHLISLDNHFPLNYLSSHKAYSEINSVFSHNSRYNYLIKTKMRLACIYANFDEALLEELKRMLDDHFFWHKMVKWLNYRCLDPNGLIYLGGKLLWGSDPSILETRIHPATSAY
jgi:hypothetical protein